MRENARDQFAVGSSFESYWQVFRDRSHCEVKQNQSNPELTSPINWDFSNMYTIERGQLRASQLAMKFGDFITKNRHVRSFRSEMRGKKVLFRSFSKTKNSAPKQNFTFHPLAKLLRDTYW